MSKKKVLATSWHPGGANAIVPVIKRLKLEDRVDVITIGHEFSEKIFEPEKIDFRTISDYGLIDVSLNSMKKLLSSESPNLILTGTSVQDEKNYDVIEQTIILAGKEKGISSLAVLDFWANYWQRFSDLGFFNTTDFNVKDKFKFLPDKVAIPDKYAEKEMLEEGFDKDKLVITGNPNFDDLEAKAGSFTEQDKMKIREQIGLNTDILLFYAANVWKKDKDAYGFWDFDNIALVDEVIKDLTGKVGLAVKLHPRTPAEDIEEIIKYLFKERENRIKLISDIHPHQLALTSDVTLTSCSTVGIEAVYMGKSCISLQPGLKTQDYLAILTKNGIIPVGYTKDDCSNLVRRVIDDKNYRENVLLEKSSSFRTDRKATERVTNLVYEMISLN